MIPSRDIIKVEAEANFQKGFQKSFELFLKKAEIDLRDAVKKGEVDVWVKMWLPADHPQFYKASNAVDNYFSTLGYKTRYSCTKQYVIISWD